MPTEAEANVAELQAALAQLDGEARERAESYVKSLRSIVALGGREMLLAYALVGSEIEVAYTRAELPAGWP